MNPPKQQIIKQIKNQMKDRARSSLVEDGEEEYGFMQIQINENMLQMEKDEVYIIFKNLWKAECLVKAGHSAFIL